MNAAERVGKNVGDLRRAAGLTQGDLARALTEIGLVWNRDLVRDVESGAREITVTELVALAAYFELPVGSIAVSPGRIIGPESVVVGNRRLTSSDWLQIWNQGRDHTKPAHALTRPAIDKITLGLARPWAKAWRKDGGEAGPAYQKAWEQLIGSRPLPGPTFVATGGPVGRGTNKPPWGQEVSLELVPGVPFVARDEVDREQLEDLERLGLVRKISAQQAYKLRHRKGGK